MIIIHGGWIGQIIKTHNDSMGRWITNILQGRKNHKVAIIAGYRVSQKTLDSTWTDTAYMQQYRALRILGIDNPNLKAQFLKDLAKHIKGLSTQQILVILAWDANEPTSTRCMQMLIGRGSKMSHSAKFYSLSIRINFLHLPTTLQKMI